LKPVSDPIVIDGQVLTKGTELVIHGRRGRFIFQDASLSSANRVVLNLIGPVGYHQNFCACYIENVKRVVRQQK
jgi:ABC-type molybdate transport system ATPase subunit